MRSTPRLCPTLPPSIGPPVALRGFALELTAGYATPVSALAHEGTSIVVSLGAVRLDARPSDGPPVEGALLEERSVVSAFGVAVETSFYWPPPPRASRPGTRRASTGGLRRGSRG